LITSQRPRSDGNESAYQPAPRLTPAAAAAAAAANDWHERAIVMKDTNTTAADLAR